MNTKLDGRIRALVVEVVEMSPAPPPFEALGELAVEQGTPARSIVARTKRPRVLIAGAVCVALALGTGALLWLGRDGDGSRIVTPGAASTRVGLHGVSVAIPKSWKAARTGTTSLVDPAEAFSVGTFPLRAGMNSCPVNALADLGTRDAFVAAYVWAAPPASDLAARPARFGPRVQWEKHDLCSRLATNGTTRSLDFQESGRQVSVTVVLGTHVSSSLACPGVSSSRLSCCGAAGLMGGDRSWSSDRKLTQERARISGPVTNGARSFDSRPPAAGTSTSSARTRPVTSGSTSSRELGSADQSAAASRHAATNFGNTAFQPLCWHRATLDRLGRGAPIPCARCRRGMGHTDFADAVRRGDLIVQGPPRLVRALPTWFLQSPFAPVELPPSM